MAKSSSRLALLAITTIALGGCTELDNSIAKVPYLAMMREAPFFDPYEAPLPAPPGSIPYEGPAGAHMPATAAHNDSISAFAATAAGQNPLKHDDPAVLAFGQTMYERNCAVCHGADGKGQGSIIGPGKFPMAPPDITTGARSEGFIYGIIRTGRGMMPSYGARVNHTERWAIASYITSLARAGGATGAEAPATTPATTPAAAPSTTSDSTTPAGQENR